MDNYSGEPLVDEQTKPRQRQTLEQMARWANVPTAGHWRTRQGSSAAADSWKPLKKRIERLMEIVPLKLALDRTTGNAPCECTYDYP